MFLNLNSTPGLPFRFKPGLPAGYEGPVLPGSDIRSASFELGMVVVQEFNDASFSLRLSIFHFLQQIRLQFNSSEPLLEVLFSLKNKFLFRARPWQKLELRQGQHACIHISGLPIEAEFEKEKEYQLFEVSCPYETIRELPIPQSKLRRCLNRTKRNQPFICSKPVKASTPAKDVIQQILRSSYEKDLRQYYFDKKVKEYLFLILLSSEANRPQVVKLTDDEKKSLIHVEQIISKKLDQYFPVPVLARQVQMNENKLQSSFKQLFGKTVFTYQRDLRLEEARRLIIDERKQIKEVYSSVGYKSITAFVTEFKKYFGYTPGSIKP